MPDGDSFKNIMSLLYIEARENTDRRGGCRRKEFTTEQRSKEATQRAVR